MTATDTTIYTESNYISHTALRDTEVICKSASIKDVLTTDNRYQKESPYGLHSLLIFVDFLQANLGMVLTDWSSIALLLILVFSSFMAILHISLDFTKILQLKQHH